MSSPNQGPSPLKIAGLVFGILTIAFVLYLLVAVSITLVLKNKIGQGDPKGFWYTDREKLKKYIFKSWIDWAGEPATFSLLKDVVPAAYDELKVITGAGAKLSNCMIQCESYSKGNTTCDGFIFTPGTSNTCTLVASMDVLMPSTGNTVYFVDGKEPEKQFFGTSSKTLGSTAPYAAKYIPGAPYHDISASACASNCISNVECTGFVFDTGAGSTVNNCLLVSNLDTSNLASAAATFTAYNLGNHAAFTASTTAYYSTT
jgi:hypothetical protein